MKRIPELDGLRGLGSLAIIFYHANPGSFYLGWTRVDLFLVLSGFLITSIVLKYGRSGRFFASFYARRVLRIWPVYFLGLAIFVAMSLLLRAQGQLDGLFKYAVFMQNVERYWLGDVPQPYYFAHTWTIALEERFYLIWPLFLFLAGPRVGAVSCGAMLFLSPLMRFMGVHSWILLGRADGLAFGCLLAILASNKEGFARHRGKYRLAFLGMMGCGLAALLGCSQVVRFEDQEIVPVPGWEWVAPLVVSASNLLYGGLLGLILSASGHRLLAPFRHPWLCAIGLISYGVYMYHPFVFWIANGVGSRLPEGYLMAMRYLGIPVTLALAALSWKYLEEPVLRLKDRFPYEARPRTASRPEPEALRAGYDAGAV